VKSDDGNLELSLSTPKALGGPDGDGTNPEQLFAAGYSACFMSALKLTMTQEKVPMPKEAYIQAKVSIGPINQGYGIAAELNIFLSDLEKNKAEDLVNKAHQVCPYSNATRGNIQVSLNII